MPITVITAKYLPLLLHESERKYEEWKIEKCGHYLELQKGE